ncbi:TonB-dependent receptor [Flavobacteriaceae bacterium AU392]|nr:TonB-dependent receptor [Flavobacteriaceae bacterium]RKM85768.1 TonB-dependent receptor [Flavobacteriaceae bacterium AU392]
MNIKLYAFKLILLLLPLFSLAQTATIKGIILDENNTPISNVNIKARELGTSTNENGFYLLKVPANTDITIVFTHLSHKKISVKFNFKNGESIEFNPVMKVDIEQITEVVIKSSDRKALEGITTIDPEIIRTIKGAQSGVENILKTLPGVSITNELSTQYNVRGGNFDENLVYVNEIEVYRPLLIRSGQQEGFSFVNSNLVQNVDFSAGGFQAKYGDKLSSVLDITYKNPIKFSLSADASLLGGSITGEVISKDSKFSGIGGIRLRDNSLLVEARQTQTNFDPLFLDGQAFLTYRFSDKFHLSFLGNASLNQYNFEPETQQTNFGTIDDPIALLVFFEGQERDEYQTLFGALKGSYFVNDDLTLKFIASTYHSQEREFFDILAQYRIGEVNNNIGSEDLGDVEFSQNIGSQLTHARNELDALITSVEHKGNYNVKENNFEWSIKYVDEDIRDRLDEFEVIDSAGFLINPPDVTPRNDEPFEPFEGPLVAFQSVNAINNTKIQRLQGYLQWSRRDEINGHEVFYNVGTRVHNWSVSGLGIEKTNQTVFSPRAQFAIKPGWKRDVLFRLSGGVYHQPPFFRELRDSSGVVQPNVKAQKSIHLVAANEYSFKMWDRPFKLITEAFYKNITDVNPYTLENVRIRYRARNSGKAFAYGLDVRLNGEFVPGTQSWFSFSYLKTEENIDGLGFIPRPTDQRLKFGVLFQDYVPNIPDLKVYLNLVYNTGVPGGTPRFADPRGFRRRLPDYRRADVGFSYDIVNGNKRYDSGWKSAFKYLSLGVEIFNIFDAQNTITNTFVRDASSRQQFAVPNFLTPRIFNVRLSTKF